MGPPGHLVAQGEVGADPGASRRGLEQGLRGGGRSRAATGERAGPQQVLAWPLLGSALAPPRPRPPAGPSFSSSLSSRFLLRRASKTFLGVFSPFFYFLFSFFSSTPYSTFVSPLFLNFLFIVVKYRM